MHVWAHQGFVQLSYKIEDKYQEDVEENRRIEKWNWKFSSIRNYTKKKCMSDWLFEVFVRAQWLNITRKAQITMTEDSAWTIVSLDMNQGNSSVKSGWIIQQYFSSSKYLKALI